jgi:hypothetical protein
MVFNIKIQVGVHAQCRHALRGVHGVGMHAILLFFSNEKKKFLRKFQRSLSSLYFMLLNNFNQIRTWYLNGNFEMSPPTASLNEIRSILTIFTLANSGETLPLRPFLSQCTEYNLVNLPIHQQLPCET